MKPDFDREKHWWDAMSAREEINSADERVNRDLRWLEIDRRLDGVKTVLEVGAATGAFTIPLAQRGLQVTHLDFSRKMLEIAREKATGIRNIRFIEGNGTDLSQFQDRSFDLVLNMDGAISFSGSAASQVIRETCRVGKTVLITVSNRANLIPIWISVSLRKFGSLKPLVAEMFENGMWRQDQYPDNPAFASGMPQDYLGPIKAFTLSELKAEIEGLGLEPLRATGVGSLAQMCGPETLEKVASSEEAYRDFLDLCDRYDQEILPGGPGTKQRAGLMISARWPR